MYTQVYDPVANSLGWSTIFAVLPLVTLFVLLGGFRVAAQWAALTALGVAIVVALAAYSMPVGQALDAGWEGATFGLFPIMWIVVNAIWIYNMTVDSGHFAVLRRSFARISDDQRIQAVIIAFCFGPLMEALAGFGTPVAISAVMLMALGFRPIKAASVALVANTAPVAFGAIAEIELADLSQTLGTDRVLDAAELRALRAYELGELDGVGVSFSDASTLLEDLIAFTASAEGEDDGDIRGSVVGTIDASGQVHRLRSIDRRWKVEGVHAAVDTGVIDLLFVCDQDDPGVASPLLSATMPIDRRFDARSKRPRLD